MSRSNAGVVHAYGVVDREVTRQAEVAGLGGAPVLTCAVGPVRTLYSVLDPGHYGERVWSEHAQDPEWVRDVARQHHGVLQAWSELSDVLPFRLPSLHAGEAGLKRAMRQRAPELSEALDASRGQREWGVKVYWEPGDSRPPEAKEAREKLPRTGRGYLLSRSRAAAARENERHLQTAAIRKIHQAFVARSSRAVVSAPLDPVLSGRRAPMLLNAAYLAPRESHPLLLRVASDCASRFQSLGLSVELTGPWPPYHFAAVRPSRREEGHERLPD